MNILLSIKFFYETDAAADFWKTVVASIIIVLGWFVPYFLTKRSESSKKSAQARASRYKEQIELFYGPLLNLLYQIRNSRIILDELKVDKHLVDDFEKYFREKYFVPVHTEITHILKTRLYLIEGDFKSLFFENGRNIIELYYQHTIQEDAQIYTKTLNKQSNLPGKHFPDDLYEAIATGLTICEAKYNNEIKKT